MAKTSTLPPAGGIAGGIATELAPDYPRQVNMKLSTQQIKNAKPSAKTIRMFDGNGLYLVNRPGFTRHLQAVHYGNQGGVYEWQTVYR